MTRLIDADALIEAMTKFANATGEDMTHGIFYANIAPTIDAVPVKRGKWIETDERDDFCGRLYECSNCKTFVLAYFDNYCPYCGADMRGEE